MIFLMLSVLATLSAVQDAADISPLLPGAAVSETVASGQPPAALGEVDQAEPSGPCAIELIMAADQHLSLIHI